MNPDNLTLSVFHKAIYKYLEKKMSLNLITLDSLSDSKEELIWDIATYIYKETGHKLDIKIINNIIDTYKNNLNDSPKSIKKTQNTLKSHTKKNYNLTERQSYIIRNLIYYNELKRIDIEDGYVDNGQQISIQSYSKSHQNCHWENRIELEKEMENYKKEKNELFSNNIISEELFEFHKENIIFLYRKLKRILCIFIKNHSTDFKKDYLKKCYNNNPLYCIGYKSVLSYELDLTYPEEKHTKLLEQIEKEFKIKIEKEKYKNRSYTVSDLFWKEICDKCYPELKEHH